MIVIGEKINGSIPAVGAAIAAKDAEVIKQRAIAQAEAGATYIDCCASVGEEIEVETLKWMIEIIESVTDKPIAVDSPSADVLAEAYKFCSRPGVINSVSGEGDKIEKIFPILAMPENKDWEVVALLSDDTGIPKTAADRLKVFDHIMAKANEYGIDASRIHIDPLVEMLCTSEDGIAMVVEVMTKIKEQYPTIHITGAVSNISFNLPYRKVLNQAFTVMSMAAGLDSAIFDPLNKALMGLIAATEAIQAAGGVKEDMDIAAIEAQIGDAAQYAFPAYVILAMNEEIIVPEIDSFGDADIESLADELIESGKVKMNPEDFTGILFATYAMMGEDDMCMNYIGAYREELFGAKK